VLGDITSITPTIGGALLSGGVGAAAATYLLQPPAPSTTAELPVAPPGTATGDDWHDS
jgi:hypothetical protein